MLVVGRQFGWFDGSKTEATTILAPSVRSACYSASLTVTNRIDDDACDPTHRGDPARSRFLALAVSCPLRNVLVLAVLFGLLGELMVLDSVG